jgi:hypothetical protein
VLFALDDTWAGDQKQSAADGYFADLEGVLHLAIGNWHLAFRRDQAPEA